MHDRRTGTTVRASISATGAPGDEESGLGGAALSADGRAAFASVATNLVRHDRNGALEDVFVRMLDDRPGGRNVASGAMPGG